MLLWFCLEPNKPCKIISGTDFIFEGSETGDLCKVNARLRRRRQTCLLEKIWRAEHEFVVSDNENEDEHATV